MAAVQAQHPIHGTDAFVITKHDTQTVDQHAGNTKGYKWCYVANNSAGGLVKVTTIDGVDISVFIAQGDVYPLAVIRVFSTGTAPTDMVGIVGKE